MRTKLTLAATGAALLLTLTSCGSNDDDAKVTKSDATPEPAATSAAPTPTPTQQTTFAIGETADVDDTANDVAFTATVIAYTQPVKGPQPPTAELGGDAWATAEIKVCSVKGQSFSVSQFPWSLAYEDGTRMEVTGLNGGDLPKPEFPTDDVSVKAGDCVRGKIPYPVQSGKRPERIVYAPQSLTEPLEWTVPAK
ncbi:DUF4352 domain-containing protein [Streptomyces sp. B1I3]|uniref:DUF4352 domain-containing protein n=1 Tax=Streptomyces sp. B1I3 TaxID=3042264 RepID=UPI00277F71B1|nr:DUF4352 domain-containing protein [Streptomyces sp. B1I3]MDQ0795586.1 hypothetical protein [Streptomyces sp. B1I3]